MAPAGRRFYSRLFIIYFLDWLVIMYVSRYPSTARRPNSTTNAWMAEQR